MTFKKLTKTERDKTFQPKIHGRGWTADTEDLEFDNIDDAIEHLGCTKQELIDVIHHYSTLTDFTSFDPKSKDDWNKYTILGRFWKYI